MEGLINNIDSNTILNVFGTIAGALIGAWIAYTVARKQINQMKNDSKIEEIKKFFKIYYVLNPLLERIMILLNERFNDATERYPKDFAKETLINHMHGYLANKYEGKQSENKDSRDIVLYHLKQIIDIKNVISDIHDTVINLKDDYIPYEFYKTYQDIIYTLKKIIDFTDEFLYYDEDIPKDEFQKKLNSFHDSHGNNEVIQYRLLESEIYGRYINDMYQYKKELEQLFDIKSNELEKLEK